MEKIEINFKSQFKNWNGFFLQLAILIPFASYSYYKYKIEMVLYPYYLFIITNFIFTVYLHVAYYTKNRGEKFIIEKHKIERIKNEKKEIFYSSDIKKIVICKSTNMDKWGIPYTTFESFRIAIVYLKSGENFIMTNLLTYDIEKPLSIIENVQFERRRGFSFFI